VEVVLFHTDTVGRTDLIRLITAVRGCFSKLFNNDDDYSKKVKQSLYRPGVAQRVPGS
jgi:hypothetical protein